MSSQSPFAGQSTNAPRSAPFHSPFSSQPLAHPSTGSMETRRSSQAAQSPFSIDTKRSDKYGQPYWQERPPPHHSRHSLPNDPNSYASHHDYHSAMSGRGREGYWRAGHTGEPSTSPEIIAAHPYQSGSVNSYSADGSRSRPEGIHTPRSIAPNGSHHHPSTRAASSHSSISTPPPSATPTGGSSGISLVFKRPQNGTDEAKDKERAKEGTASPGAASNGGSAKKRRKILEVAPNPSRASRSRHTSPHLSDSAFGTGSSAPRSSANTPIPSALATSSTVADPSLPPSLHIFAPPPESALPQALQAVITSSSSAHKSSPPPGRSAASVIDKDGDVLMKEASEGFDRRRSARAKLGPASYSESESVRTGVAANGKGVKVGGPIKDPEQKVVKKKGKKNVEVPNQDFCSACRGVGKFLCCDGCPRSFHFMCLEPPLRIDELPEEETWFCKKCRAERGLNPPVPSPPPNEREPRPIPLTFKHLVKRIEEDNPSTFRLPMDIRQFFTGVATDGRGNYVDQDEARTKYDRKGFQEERDGTRLRDAKSRPVACYVCGGSSIPLRSQATDPESTWRQIVSCDYCALHWHLDCLSPPLATMPNSGRKWMCPNHVEQVMARRRTVKNHLQTVDVDSEGTPNNGNITIISDDEGKEPIEYEDLVINRKKYRVPEKIIRLDFWGKLGLGKGRKVAPAKGGDGVFEKRKRPRSLFDVTSDESDVSEDDPPEPDQEDLEAAALVLSLMNGAASGTTADKNKDVEAEESMSADKATEIAAKTEPVADDPVNASSRPAGETEIEGTPNSSPSTRGSGTKITLRLSRPAQ